MTNDKGILIKNIYYMLTYAFKELRQNNYEQIAGEDFEDIYELFAEILSKGVAYLLKQGLHREYVTVNETIPTLRGKLDIQGTIGERLKQHALLACEHDTLSENNLFNQIIKTSVELLLNHSDVRRTQKHKLKQLLLFFEHVDCISPSNIKWDRLRYDRNSRSYQMLHSLCFFLLHSKLLTTEDGQTKMAHFSDEHMNMLFQRFVMEYYRRHHHEYNASAKQIQWNLETIGSNSANMLPVMQTDITLSLNGRTLIIDTKYYSQNMQENFGKLSLNSPNMYQIHTYVMSEDVKHTGKVDGMLLYAKTVSDQQPYYNGVTPDGNIIMVRTIDLNRNFSDIKQQLEELTTYNKLLNN
jgi:5-methylcytosine-specific restriction enzyme subunit McrC